MKKLKLPITRSREEKAMYKYYILFDIGRRVEFKSKRKAEDFSRKITTYTSDSIRNMFMIHKELYSSYLDNFFKFTPYQDNKIRQTLSDFLTEITFFYKDYGKGNQCIKVNGYYRILSHLYTSCEVLKKYYKINQMHHEYNRVQACYQLIRMYYDSFNTIVDKEHVVDLSYRKGTDLKIIFNKKEEERINVSDII